MAPMLAAHRRRHHHARSFLQHHATPAAPTPPHYANPLTYPCATRLNLVYCCWQTEGRKGETIDPNKIGLLGAIVNSEEGASGLSGGASLAPFCALFNHTRACARGSQVANNANHNAVGCVCWRPEQHIAICAAA